MLGVDVNSLAKKRDLHFDGTGIALKDRVLGSNLLLYSGIEYYNYISDFLRVAPLHVHSGSIESESVLTTSARHSVLICKTQLGTGLIHISFHLGNQVIGVVELNVAA